MLGEVSFPTTLLPTRVVVRFVMMVMVMRSGPSTLLLLILLLLVLLMLLSSLVLPTLTRGTAASAEPIPDLQTHELLHREFESDTAERRESLLDLVRRIEVLQETVVATSDPDDVIPGPRW